MNGNKWIRVASVYVLLMSNVCCLAEACQAKQKINIDLDRIIMNPRGSGAGITSESTHDASKKRHFEPEINAAIADNRADKYPFYGQNALHDPFKFAYIYDREIWPINRYLKKVIDGDIPLLLNFSAKNVTEDTVYRVPILTRDQAVLAGEPEHRQARQYWKTWAVKRFGEGTYYRLLAFEGTDFAGVMTSTEVDDIFAQLKPPVEDEMFSKIKPALDRDDPVAWYFHARALLRRHHPRYEPVHMERDGPFNAMKKAAALGVPEAQAWMGRVYYFGNDTGRRLKWYQDELSSYRVTPDRRQILMYSERALRDGVRETLLDLAYSYSGEFLLPVDYKRALLYFMAYTPDMGDVFYQKHSQELSETDYREAREKAGELRELCRAGAMRREEEEKRRKEDDARWLSAFRADIDKNCPWLKWALVPKELYDRIKPELERAALERGLAERDAEGNIYALRDITWQEYIEMDRDNRVKRWEALPEEERGLYPRPE